MRARVCSVLGGSAALRLIDFVYNMIIIIDNVVATQFVFHYVIFQSILGAWKLNE